MVVHVVGQVDDLLVIVISDSIEVGTAHEVALIQSHGPVGLDELDGTALVLSNVVQGVAHGLAVALFGSVLLVVDLLALTADGVLSASEVAQSTVAGAVHVDLAFDSEALLSGHLIAVHPLDLLAVGMDGLHGGVQIDGQVLLSLGCAPQDCVPDRVVIVIVQVLVLQHQFHQNAGLGSVLLAPVAGSAGDVHSHFGAGVTAEDGTILHQNSLRAFTGGSDSGTQTTHTAADDDNIKLLLHTGVQGRCGSFMNKSFHILSFQDVQL